MAELNESDHNMLIRLDTKMDIVLGVLKDVIERYDGLAARVSALEAKDRGDSERIGSVVEAVKGSNNNSTRISEAHIRIDNLVEDVNDLKSKSNRNDALNAIFAGVSGVIGFFFGNK